VTSKAPSGEKEAFELQLLDGKRLTRLFVDVS
jgi:hypothetical protein